MTLRRPTLIPAAFVERGCPGLRFAFTNELTRTGLDTSWPARNHRKGLSLCCAHPDGKSLIVVSRGTAFVVHATNPATWLEVEVRPILGYCADNREKNLVFYGDTDMVGMRADGTMCRTPRLSWDGLRSVRIVNSIVLGEGWDASKSAYVPFKVDVTTGASTGGAAPPNLTTSH